MRESRYVQVARIGYVLAQATLPRYSHTKSPRRFTLPQRAACVVLMTSLRLSSRDMEEWLLGQQLLASSEVRTVLDLGEQVPDHSTLTHTQAQLTMARLTGTQLTLLQKLEVEEVAVAVDTTNFRLQHANAYYMTRTGRLYRVCRHLLSRSVQNSPE